MVVGEWISLADCQVSNVPTQVQHTLNMSYRILKLSFVEDYLQVYHEN